MNGTLMQDFNTLDQLQALDSVVLLVGGACNITYFSAERFHLNRGPLIYNAGVLFLMAYSTFL